MSCGYTTNGKPPVDYFWVVRGSVAGANPLSIAWTAPTWVQLCQITANWDVLPVTSESIVFWKNHSGVLYDVTFAANDPTVLGNTSFWCNNCWLFEPGEIISVDYPNSDGRTVGAELYIKRIPQ